MQHVWKRRLVMAAASTALAAGGVLGTATAASATPLQGGTRVTWDHDRGWDHDSGWWDHDRGWDHGYRHDKHWSSDDCDD